MSNILWPAAISKHLLPDGVGVMERPHYRKDGSKKYIVFYLRVWLGECNTKREAIRIAKTFLKGTKVE
jgi:hypothetical protein